MLGLNDDCVGGVGGDFWLMGFSLGFAMGMAEQKNVMAMLPFYLVTVGGLHHFAKKLELKSERYNSCLEPNTNFREI